ncbi:hypothetical protein FBU59_000279 [Linderina macrospora]|uniref:Uncharacterized protein n=1 Tax=Linderina macrospora TaxID=4868 RepID=A0ACC1JH40_9FUNG|nr:hypothetical protein FBU59_000279 [Linderina macrospora]
MAQFVDLSLRALVKLTPVMGAPKTYLAASIIHDSLNNDIKSKLDKTRFRSDSDTDYETILNRGMSFLRILGGFKSSIIFEKASAICPELKYLAPVDIYGRIVSSGQIMPLKETELCIYASAVAQGIPLIGEPHARGAIYFGATDDEIEAARNLGIMALNMIS